jgi:hypothetical protein
LRLRVRQADHDRARICPCRRPAERHEIGFDDDLACRETLAEASLRVE